MSIRSLFAAAALALAANGAAHATDVHVVADGSWYAFDVSDQAAPDYSLAWIDVLDGSPLSFHLAVAAGQVGTLTVVDAVFGGDRFAVYRNGSLLGNTSAVASSAADVGYDYDLALANPGDFSRGTFTLQAGNYAITGLLIGSALDVDGVPFNATNGALKFTVAVPEVQSVALMLAGLGALGAVLRRRRAA